MSDNYVNVKDKGAVGDGLTDDTDAIQRAIDAIPVGQGVGGVVYFPAGTYKITRPLRVKKSFITLTGAENGRALLYGRAFMPLVCVGPGNLNDTSSEAHARGVSSSYYDPIPLGAALVPYAGDDQDWTVGADPSATAPPWNKATVHSFKMSRKAKVHRGPPWWARDPANDPSDRPGEFSPWARFITGAPTVRLAAADDPLNPPPRYYLNLRDAMDFYDAFPGRPIEAWSEFTVECFFRVDDDPKTTSITLINVGGRRLSSESDDVVKRIFWLGSWGDQVTAQLQVDGYKDKNGKPTLVLVQSPADTIKIGQVHHVAFTFDGKVARLFVDGNLAGKVNVSDVTTPIPIRIAGDITLGLTPDDWPDGNAAGMWNGYIDSVRICKSGQIYPGDANFPKPTFKLQPRVEKDTNGINVTRLLLNFTFNYEIFTKGWINSLSGAEHAWLTLRRLEAGGTYAAIGHVDIRSLSFGDIGTGIFAYRTNNFIAENIVCQGRYGIQLWNNCYGASIKNVEAQCNRGAVWITNTSGLSQGDNLYLAQCGGYPLVVSDSDGTQISNSYLNGTFLGGGGIFKSATGIGSVLLTNVHFGDEHLNPNGNEFIGALLFSVMKTACCVLCEVDYRTPGVLKPCVVLDDGTAHTFISCAFKGEPGAPELIHTQQPSQPNEMTPGVMVNSILLIQPLFPTNGIPWCNDMSKVQILGNGTLTTHAISQSPAFGKNLRGSEKIERAAFKRVNLEPEPAEPNGDYFINACVSNFSDGASQGSKRVCVRNKIAGSFELHLEEDPGEGEWVSVDWILMR